MSQLVPQFVICKLLIAAEIVFPRHVKPTEVDCNSQLILAFSYLTQMKNRRLQAGTCTNYNNRIIASP